MKKLKTYLTNPSSVKRLAFFRNHLKESALWRANAQTLSRGAAAGLTAAFIPIIPLQTLLAVLFVILIRGNLPLAFIVSWISNPVTYIPIAYFTYHVGEWILREPHASHVTQMGKTYVLGVIVVALCAGVTGYLITWIICSLMNSLKNRKQKKLP